VDLGHIEAFVQVANHRSFSKAAVAHFLTQPSITARIQSLERELGEGITALAAEADKFRAALVRAYSQELDAKATEVAEVLRPLFPDEINPINSQRTDRALNLARQSKDCTALHARIVELEGIRWADQPRSNNPSQWDGELLTAVESLLRFGENS